jgi:hypothetical protein
MYFSIFGLQRSGTTFLEFLIKKNFEAELKNEADWKHSLSKIEKDHTIFNIYKNPYLWVESVVFREPADLLVVYPHLLEDGYVVGCDKINLANLAKLYNDYTLNWYNPDTLVKYEDLINDKTLNDFFKRVPFRRTTTYVQKVEPGSLFMSEGFTNDRIPYYLKQVPTILSDEHIHIINQNISNEVFDMLGYKRLDT